MARPIPLLALVLFTVFATPSQAGTLWPTATVLGEDAVPLPPDGIPLPCMAHPHFALNLTAPADGSVPLPTTSLLNACSFQLDYNATTAFTLSGTGVMTLIFGCEAVAAATPVDGSDTRVTLFVNDEEIATHTVFDSPAFTCTPTGDQIQVTHELDLGETAVAAGDVLSIQVVYWFMQPPAEAAAVSLVVGSAGSSFVADGFPVPGAPATLDSNSSESMTAAPTPSPTSSATSSTTAPLAEDPTSGRQDDTATGGFPLRTEEKDAPSPGVLVTSLGLLALVIAARRRIS